MKQKGIEKIEEIESGLFEKLSGIGKPDRFGVDEGSTQMTTLTDERSDITTDGAERRGRGW